MEYGRDFESCHIIDEIPPVWRKILAMRVTMQFICVLRNLHVKEAQCNNEYLRRIAFFAVSTRGVLKNITMMLVVSADKWISICPFRSFDVFPQTPRISNLKRE